MEPIPAFKVSRRREVLATAVKACCTVQPKATASTNRHCRQFLGLPLFRYTANIERQQRKFRWCGAGFHSVPFAKHTEIFSIRKATTVVKHGSQVWRAGPFCWQTVRSESRQRFEPCCPHAAEKHHQCGHGIPLSCRMLSRSSETDQSALFVWIGFVPFGIVRALPLRKASRTVFCVNVKKLSTQPCPIIAHAGAPPWRTGPAVRK